MTSIALRATLILLAILNGCSTHPAFGPYAAPTSQDRDPRLALQLNERAASVLASDPEEAERLLLAALTADIFCGEAHNNLGVVLLQRDQLFQAAGEFEWARKLLPGHPDPRLNLAITLERAGRMDQALAEYRSALEVHPDHVPSKQGLVRLMLYTGRDDDARIASLLSDVALQGETQVWREWAQAELARLD